MGELFDVEAWREIVIRSGSELGATLAGFLPNLMGAALILLFGFAVSKAVSLATARMLRGFGVDRAGERLGLAEVLERGGIRAGPSEIVALLVFWLLMLTFVLSGVETLGLSAVTTTIDRVVAYIPNLIGAGFIALLGLLAARFVRGVVSSGAAAAGIPSAPRLGFLAQALVALVVIVAAAEQLGVDTAVLVGPLTAATAAAVGTAGLALALGARPVVGHVLAGHYLRQSLPRGVTVEIDGRRGVVERVGSTETVLVGEVASWSIPNAQLLELTVVQAVATATAPVR